MSPAYKLLVKQHYVKKKNEHALPSGLMYPTTAKLKEQCLVGLAKGLSPRDRKVLIDFFGECEDDDAILKKIKRSRTDDFRAVWNYLNKDLKKPSIENVELVAWLIGFEPRPYDPLKNYDSEVVGTAVTVPEAVQDDNKNIDNEGEKASPVGGNRKPEDEVVEGDLQVPTSVIPDRPTKQDDNSSKKGTSFSLALNAFKQPVNQKKLLATLVVVILTTVVIFMYKGDALKNLIGSALNKDGGCMYWAGDHYQQVPCNQKMGIDTFVIALDIEKLNSFKKITRPDTITNNCIGRVWYIKIDNKVEFFTASGNYPLDLTRRLKPLTGHIISTYIDTARQNISN